MGIISEIFSLIYDGCQCAWLRGVSGTFLSSFGDMLSYAPPVLEMLFGCFSNIIFTFDTWFSVILCCED